MGMCRTHGLRRRSRRTVVVYSSVQSTLNSSVNAQSTSNNKRNIQLKLLFLFLTSNVVFLTKFNVECTDDCTSNDRRLRFSQQLVYLGAAPSGEGVVPCRPCSRRVSGCPPAPPSRGTFPRLHRGRRDRGVRKGHRQCVSASSKVDPSACASASREMAT
jgi:hypothetical protein